nr:MAG TPA: hypothetical protein [Caudoviricetes sp.]
MIQRYYFIGSYPSSIMLIITNRDINKNATYSHEQMA